MKLLNAKTFFVYFLLLLYISIALFGLFQFSHAADMPMNNCPYAQNSFSVCSNNLDHINNWRQFSSITFPRILAFLLLTLGIVLYFFHQQDLSGPKRHFYKWKYSLENQKSYSYFQEIIEWLALFENSPSLSYVRHS